MNIRLPELIIGIMLCFMQHPIMGVILIIDSISRIQSNGR